jgi:hypothetical protein
MRQTEYRNKKVKNIVSEIRERWDALTDKEKKDYESKAKYVGDQMKCRKYQ